MAMNNVSTAARNAKCDALVDLVDSGAGTSHIRIYTAAFGTLLAELDFSATAFGAASSGAATANAITAEASAPATGTAAVHRVVDKDGNTVWEGTVGSGSGDIDLNTTGITTGDSVTISSYVVTEPAS